MMKKMMMTVWMMTTLSLLGGLCFGQATFAANFSDMESHWSAPYVTPLVDQKVISGYSDGTYRPDATIKRIEFITLSVNVLVKEGVTTVDTNVPSGTYWGQPFIDKAIEMGLIEADEFDDYETPITREEMASIAIKAFGKFNVIGTSTITEEVIKDIKDYPSVNDEYKDEVLNIYMEGIITGKPGGYFDPKGNATRGESAVVILKMIDDSKRQAITIDDIPHVVTEYQYLTSGGTIETTQITLYAPIGCDGERIPEILDIFTTAKAESALSPYDAGAAYDPVGESINIGTSYLTWEEYAAASFLKSAEQQQTNFSIRLFQLSDEEQYPYKLGFFGIQDHDFFDKYLDQYPETWSSLMTYLFGAEGGKTLEQKIRQCANGNYTDPNYGTFSFELKSPINGRKFTISGGTNTLNIYISNDVY